MFNDNLYFGILFTVFVFVFLFFCFGLIKKSKSKNEKNILRQYYINKLVWIFFICLSVYYGLTMPYIGRFYKSKRNLPSPNSAVQNIDTKEYLLEHQYRIEDLESELTDTKTELRELKDNYQGVYLTIMLAVIMFGGVQIFGTSKEEWLNKHKNEIEK